MKILGILSPDPRLVRKLELLLREEYEVRAVTDGGADGCDILIVDVDFLDTEHKRKVRLSRDPQRGDAITLPFSHTELRAAVRAVDTEPDCGLSLSSGECAAYLGTRKIKLTEVEYKLLGALLRADGFVSREALLDEVWGGARDAGVVNVYVHYLREKLECEGEKVILSSRREGYRIDARYRRAKEC